MLVSTPTPKAYRPAVVLPSIHEIFPEHLVLRAPYIAPRRQGQKSPAVTPQPTWGLPPARPPPSSHPYSFDLLRSDPRVSSLTHIASSQSTLTLNSAARDARGHSSSSSSLGAGSPDSDVIELDTDADETEGTDGEANAQGGGRKHICPTCAKGFNRPSSLGIHQNTHTGATREYP
ncbi:hypothetical protein DFH06DRAFT_1330773 [Mycena polygramma]|nr:hypothetical protein DFH06DRAFT_1330773 [Mycena polygramma]